MDHSNLDHLAFIAFILNAAQQDGVIRKRNYSYTAVTLSFKTKSNLRKLTNTANSSLEKWRSSYQDIPEKTAEYLLLAEHLCLTIVLELEENARKRLDCHALPNPIITRTLLSSTTQTLSSPIMDGNIDIEECTMPAEETVNSAENNAVPMANTTSFPIASNNYSEDRNDDDAQDDIVLFQEVYTFKRILQHWVTSRRISHAAVDELLELLITHKPTLDCRDLPKTCKTLLKVPEETRKSVQIKKVMGPVINDKPEEVGEYMYLGVENGIKGTSIGVLNKLEHAIAMKKVEIASPGLLPEEIVRETAEITKAHEKLVDRIAKVQPGYEAKSTMAASNDGEEDNWSDEDIPDIRIIVNIDGVQLEKSNDKKVLPILGKIWSVARSSVEVTIPDAPIFVIAIFRGTTYDIRDVTGDFVTELANLEDPTEKRKFTVTLVCMTCDAVGRIELKGITNFNGYLGCERCVTMGAYATSTLLTSKNSKNKITFRTALRFPELHAPRRKDKAWCDYKRPICVSDFFKLYLLIN